MLNWGESVMIYDMTLMDIVYIQMWPWLTYYKPYLCYIPSRPHRWELKIATSKCGNQDETMHKAVGMINIYIYIY